MQANDPTPAYLRVKRYIEDGIRAGRWTAALPSEQALSEQFSVSRMTVNRAMRELADAQVVERRRGAGTFVAQEKYASTLVQIRNIADEIAARGHEHQSVLHKLERLPAPTELAKKLGLKKGAEIFHSLVLHLENGDPIQLEDRYVNPAVAPDYMAQDFQTQTPNAYLMRVAPLQAVEFAIEAALPTATVAQLLAIPVTQPCLVLHRQTQSRSAIASIATLWHPAQRYRFTGAF